MSLLGQLNFRRMEECSTLLRWLDARPGERILDIGCGNGYYDGLIAKLGAEVVGIDVAGAALQTALNRRASPSCTFIQMAAEDLSFPDVSFDKVVSFCVMEHLANDRQVMRHVNRMLRPGGRFVFSADSLSNPGVTNEERTRHERRYAVNTFYTIDEVREKLSDTGFEIEEYRSILNTPLALALVRFSWWLDRLPRVFASIRGLGYLTLLAFYKMNDRFPSRLSVHADRGLTLLVRAKKRSDQ